MRLCFLVGDVSADWLPCFCESSDPDGEPAPPLASSPCSCSSSTCGVAMGESLVSSGCRGVRLVLSLSFGGVGISCVMRDGGVESGVS